MIRTSFAPLFALSLAIAASPTHQVEAQVGLPPVGDVNDQSRYSANQLDNLVGPIALYPDALLAQVLVAATFPDQIDDAAKWVRSNGTNGIDDQSWDVSVRAVAHYPSALNMMADKIDWTSTLGRAYANQSSDVMIAVQRMRTMADGQGNLVSTQQQQVVRDNGNYVIVPTQPRVIYVPVYDPYYIYTRPVFGVGVSSRFWSFGIGFPIGGWLNYDLDWRARSVYYNGWNDAYFGYGGGWRARSRPFIQVTNVYVNPRYTNVYVNRDVFRRPVDYRNVDRYAGVHRDTYFGGRRDGNGNGDIRQVRDVRDGRDNRDSRSWPYGSDVGRTAQARDERPSATPDGYRNGGDRGSVDRSTGNGTNGDRNNGDRNNGDRGTGDRNAPTTPRGTQAVPDSRRREPVVRSGDMTVTPDVRRAPRDGGSRDGGSRDAGVAQPRAPQVERQAPPPRVEAPRQAPQERAPASKGGGDERRAVPRGGRPPSEASGERRGR